MALACLGALAVAPAAIAQDAAKDFPNRAIHIVVPFPAGGPADVAARIIGQKMSEDWGQPVIVDNRPGGNTVIGAVQVAKATPDGYTLLMAINSTLVMNQFLYKTLAYDPINDFAPITSTTKTVSVLAVRAADGPKDVKELIAQGQGRARQAQLRRRHHHRATDGVSLPQGRRSRHRLRAVQGHARDRQRAADRQRRPDLRRQCHRQSADRERQGAGAGQARPPAGSGRGRVADARRGRRPARRGHVGLARPGGAQGHAARDHRQAPAEGRADPGRSGGAPNAPTAPAPTR